MKITKRDSAIFQKMHNKYGMNILNPYDQKKMEDNKKQTNKQKKTNQKNPQKP